MRMCVKDQGLEDVLRKFSRDNKDQITEDDLLIGISKINANVHIADIKELAKILRGGDSQNSSDKISIAETVQLIAN
jgi:hypothetical protein